MPNAINPYVPSSVPTPSSTGVGPSNRVPSVSALVNALESVSNRAAGMQEARFVMGVVPNRSSPAERLEALLNARAQSHVPPFSADGKLTPEALAWADVVALELAQVSAGSHGHVATGLFALLSTGETARAIPSFDSMIDYVNPSTKFVRSLPTIPVDHVMKLLHDQGLKVHADLFVNEMSPNWPDSNLKALSSLTPQHSFTTHPLELSGPAEGLRSKINAMKEGEAAILFINKLSVITIARGSDGWHVFDSGLNSAFNRSGLSGVPLNGLLESQTADQRSSHVHGAEAEAMLDKYLARHQGQPVLIRLARS